jgi:hypothetical protein
MLYLSSFVGFEMMRVRGEVRQDIRARGGIEGGLIESMD